MARLHVLRVFTAPDGSHGNHLGVFLEGAEVPAPARQAIARDLGYAETVFVEDPVRGAIRIHTPAEELPFAGHPTVGTAWLLATERGALESLLAPAGELAVRHEEGLTWIRARPEWSPPFEYRQYGSAGEVDALEPADRLRYAWAWEDEEAGSVRARSFVPDLGIAEDEATGSAALALCALVGRPIEVRQGRGSMISARPLEAGYAEIGGRVALEEVRAYELPEPG